MLTIRYELDHPIRLVYDSEGVREGAVFANYRKIYQLEITLSFLWEENYPLIGPFLYIWMLRKLGIPPYRQI